MMLRHYSLRLKVATVQQQFHLLHTSLLRAHSLKRLCAPACGQQRWNEQALPAEQLCKFYYLGDMFGIRSRIYCPRFLYNKSSMPPMFSG
jgi:hypothetical protein